MHSAVFTVCSLSRQAFTVCSLSLQAAHLRECPDAPQYFLTHCKGVESDLYTYNRAWPPNQGPRASQKSTFATGMRREPVDAQARSGASREISGHLGKSRVFGDLD